MVYEFPTIVQALKRLNWQVNGIVEQSWRLFSRVMESPNHSLFKHVIDQKLMLLPMAQLLTDLWW